MRGGGLRRAKLGRGKVCLASGLVFVAGLATSEEKSGKVCPVGRFSSPRCSIANSFPPFAPPRRSLLPTARSSPPLDHCSFGLPVYTSNPHEHVITSVAWRPNGTAFAVGSYNVLRLCDKTGWTYGRERPEVGSIMKIRWSPDGTQLAGACGGGRVAFAQLTDRSLEYGSVTATLTEPKKILVEDARNTDDGEELDFPRDRVVEFALGYEHLVVCTASQCFIYESPNYNTPQIFDLRNPVNLIVLSQKNFAIVDTVQGIGVYNYEGRQLSTPRWVGGGGAASEASRWVGYGSTRRRHAVPWRAWECGKETRRAATSVGSAGSGHIVLSRFNFLCAYSQHTPFPNALPQPLPNSPLAGSRA